MGFAIMRDPWDFARERVIPFGLSHHHERQGAVDFRFDIGHEAFGKILVTLTELVLCVLADQWLAACKKSNTTCDDFDFLATHFYTCSVDNLAA